MALALQVITAFLTDAAYRPELMRDARATFGTMYASLAASPGGALSVYAPRELAGGDRRFGTPQTDELFSRQLDELRVWLEPQFKHGPIELSVVGDVTWDEARRAVARTLGALGRRDPRRSAAQDTSVRPPATPPAAPKIYAIDPKLRQCALSWFWPIGPLADIHEERRCRLLAAVLHDRCRVRLREELGAAYSPVASFTETRGFPYLTYFSAYAEVPLARADAAMRIVENEANSLAKKGVQADEFMRARQPFLHDRDDDLRTNAYWGGTVLSDAQENPSRLAAARDRTTDTAAITVQELSALAKRHLAAAKSFRFVTVPVAPSAAPGQPAAGSAGAGRTTGQPP